MLVTYGEGEAAVKAGWNTPPSTLMSELKNLTAHDLSRPGEALKTTLDLLNLYRLQTGIDTYAQGRKPWFAEPAVILAVSDGGLSTSLKGATEQLTLPMGESKPGSELTHEPFRWDQRLFHITLRVSGTAVQGPALDTEAGIAAMCEVMGGKSFVAASQKAMVQCLESINSRVHPGVLVSFEPLPKDGSRGAPMPGARDKLIHLRPNQAGRLQGHWPIPENFWPPKITAAPPPPAGRPPHNLVRSGRV